jgi:hypothetical protein
MNLQDKQFFRYIYGVDIQQLLISALKSKLFPAEDRQPKSVVFG